LANKTPERDNQTASVLTITKKQEGLIHQNLYILLSILSQN